MTTHRYSSCMTESTNRPMRARGRTGLCLLAAAAMLSGSTVVADPPVVNPPVVNPPVGATPEQKPVQEAPKADAPKSNAPKSNTPKSNTPRSLDDLLGVPNSESLGASAEDAARREQEKRLEQSLNEASMSDLVQRAVEGMKSASDRLSDAKDAGLGTQRIQEDVVKTLDRLLEEAQRRQNKQQSSSSKKKSSQQQKDDPSEQNGQQQKQQQQQRKRQQGSQPSSSSDSSDDSRNGTRDAAVAETQELSESRIEWGRLPERVRELVLQGRRDRVSTIYERLTREYYRRLAEEASR